jgi:hypothetical protein
MQGAGHSIAEVTGVALGVIRFIITDVANPGGSFHIVTAAHAFSLEFKFLILKLPSIMPLLEDKGKRLRSKKGIVIDDYAFGFFTDWGSQLLPEKLPQQLSFGQANNNFA